MAVSFSGSLDISGSLTTTGTIVMSGSIASASYAANATTASNANTSSYVVSSQTDATQNTRLTTIEAVTGSYTTTSSFGSYTASNDTTNTTQNSRIASNEAKTGSYATTGSNYFIGTQVVTGSVYISSDLVVQGSSSLQNITASAVSIGTNTVILNTSTPILQFGGISVQDSGSAQGRSGSLFWDSLNDHWINVNPSGSNEGYNSAMVINGPKNTGSLGSEAGLTTGYIPRSQGEDHLEDSNIFSTGSNVGINTSTVVEGTQSASSLSFIPSSSVSGGPLIQFPSNGRIRPASTGDRLSIDGNALFLNGTFSSNVAIATGGGNVGVGTSSPVRKFVVAADDTNSGDSGQFHIIGATNANLKLMLGYDTTSEYAYIKATKSGTATRNLALQPDGSNVGIGTTSPTTLLNIVGSTSTSKISIQSNASNFGQIQVTNNTAGGEASIGFIGGSGSLLSTPISSDGDAAIFGIGSHIYGMGTNKFGIGNKAYGGTIFTVVSSGNVGIGTVSPNSLVEIAKSSNAGSGATFPRLSVANTLATQGDGSSTYNFADLRLAAGNAAVEVYLTATYAAGTWAPQGILNVATNHPLAFKTNNTERMRITSGGELLTWNTNEDVYDENTSSNVKGYWSNQFSTANGTTRKTLLGSTSTSGIVGFAGTNSSSKYIITAGIYGIMTSTTAGAETGDLAFYTKPSNSGMSSNERMRITATGNVGIGSTSPPAPLTVQSTGATGLLLEQDKSNSAVSSRLVARNNSITGTIRYDSSGWRFNTNATLNETSGTERALISTDGYFRMLTGTGGIQFQGNTSAANALNYYEQGSWTPSLQNATVSYTDRSGTYVRIGDYVFVRWGFRISSISGQSGTVQINGLPFTAVSWGSYQEPNISVSTGNLATADNAYRARVFVGGGGTALYGRLTNNGDTPWPTSEIQNGTWIIGEIFYNVP